MTANKREEMLTKAKPILFNTKMVKAILDGRKTVTRRVIKPQPLLRLAYIFAGYGCGKWGYPDKNAYKYWGEEFKQNIELSEKERKRLWTPPCHTDDILYVRETWGTYSVCEGIMPTIYYKADGNAPDKIKWKPSIHMPKEAARIFLRVTDVRVERLQDISADDVVKEGLNTMCAIFRDFEISQLEYANLWNSTVKKSDLYRYGWDANPWVWVIEFERID